MTEAVPKPIEGGVCGYITDIVLTLGIILCSVTLLKFFTEDFNKIAENSADLNSWKTVIAFGFGIIIICVTMCIRIVKKRKTCCLVGGEA